MAALDGGPDGLEPYRAIASGAGGFLAENGIIGVEIGYDQKQDVETIFKAAGFPCIAAMKDYGENDRVLVFRK
ncbi:Release factor glutamine methyltransferase [compost metagenome]